jgi:hypothetical protein
MELDSIPLDGQSKPVVRPGSLDELRRAWQLLGFDREQPAIVIVGGAGGMTENNILNVQRFFERYLVPFAAKRNAAIIDGGTNSGVMAAIGRARQLARNDFPLVGVVARDIENIASMLEPNHSHFILCPGDQWGVESEWIAAAASALCGSLSSIAILINGGMIAWEDARLNLHYGRPIVVAEESGRTADLIATTSSKISFEPKALALLRTGKVHVANFFKDPGGFIEKLNDLMR